MSEVVSLEEQLKNRHFSCSNCVFANISPPASGGPFGVYQVGCKTWRLDHYIAEGKAELAAPTEYATEVNSFYKLKSQKQIKFNNLVCFEKINSFDVEINNFKETIISFIKIFMK